MNKFFENITSLISKNSNGDMIVPDGIKSRISNIGVQGGQKYSDVVDSIVDFIFNKKK